MERTKKARPALRIAGVLIRVNGRQRKVIMQANRNGYFYVIDRTSSEFISGAPVKPVSWARGLDPKTGRPRSIPKRITRPSEA